jgi:hypothetical protein
MGVGRLLQVATQTDIDEVLALHSRYQIDGIAEEDRADGFVTTAFSRDQLEQLIAEEQGLFIARIDAKVVAYVMAASWSYWSKWPLFKYMIKGLPQMHYIGIQLNTENSYQYGPVCVDKLHRGSGLLEKLFAFALEQMAGRFQVLVTFVNRQNPRSFAAHSRKLGLDVIASFEFNGNRYYELACMTNRGQESGTISVCN